MWSAEGFDSREKLLIASRLPKMRSAGISLPLIFGLSLCLMCILLLSALLFVMPAIFDKPKEPPSAIDLLKFTQISKSVFSTLHVRFSQREKAKLRSTSTAIHHNSQPPLFFTHQDLRNIGAGLGNFMFIVASLHAITKDNNNRTFALLEQHKHESHFYDLEIPHISARDHLTLTLSTWKEIDWAKYNPDVLKIDSKTSQKNVSFEGYFQQHRNFHKSRAEIRNMFVFRRNITDMALGLLKTNFQRLKQTGFGQTLPSRPRLVGIHVRRGDVLLENVQKAGHLPASDSYLLKTVEHVGSQHKSVVFVVLSNDMPYCKTLFQGENFIFMDDGQAPAVDMAILGVMDTVILTVGSFGWWGAYLSDAKEVYYYQDWPRPGSEIDRGFNAKDYFPSTWIPRK